VSIDTCKDCGRMVNTDADAEAYVEVGNMKRLHAVVCLCRLCREEREAREEYDQSQADMAQEAAERAGALS